MAKIKLAYPIAEAHGYLDREKDIEGNTFGGFGITCTPNGHQVSFRRKNKRNLQAHPVSQDELTQRSKFSAGAKEVARRMDSDASTYMQDLAQYSIADKKEYPTFKKWLWAQVKKA